MLNIDMLAVIQCIYISLFWYPGGGAAHWDLPLTLQQCFGPQEQLSVGGGATDLPTEQDLKLLLLGVFMWMCSVKAFRG